MYWVASAGIAVAEQVPFGFWRATDWTRDPAGAPADQLKQSPETCRNSLYAAGSENTDFSSIALNLSPREAERHDPVEERQCRDDRPPRNREGRSAGIGQKVVALLTLQVMPLRMLPPVAKPISVPNVSR